MKSINLVICFIFLSIAFFTPLPAASLEQILKAMNDYETHARKTVNDITILLQFKTIAKGRESVSYELVLRNGEKYRLERTRPDTLFSGNIELLPVTLFDGKTTWTVDSEGNKTMTVFEEWRLHPYLAWDWSSLISPKSKLVRVDEVGGQPAYCIELPPGWLILPFKSIWLDIQKPVLVRAQSTKMLFVYSQYQPVLEGVDLPFRTETFSGGDYMTLTTVKTVEVNQGMEDDLFNPDLVSAQSCRLLAMLNRLKLIEEE